MPGYIEGYLSWRTFSFVGLRVPTYEELTSASGFRLPTYVTVIVREVGTHAVVEVGRSFKGTLPAHEFYF